MGFAVPAAMGVALARPDEPVWAISGDGGFQMNMQEIATMVQEGIPVKMAIFNNGYLGHGAAVAAVLPRPPLLGDADLESRLRPAGGGVRHPGLAGRDRRPGGGRGARRRWREPGPALVEFMIEQEANVFPMIPPGASLSEPIEGGARSALVPA